MSNNNSEIDSRRGHIYCSFRVLSLTLFFCIVIVEAIFISALYFLPGLPHAVLVAISVGVSAIIILPAVYFSVYLPSAQQAKSPVKSEAELREIADTLEDEVRERVDKLAGSAAESRAVLESSADAIVRIDTDGKIYSANQATYKIFGYRSRDLIGKNISIILPSDYQKILVDGFLSTLSDWGTDNVIPSNEVQAVTRFGNSIPIELTISECIIKPKLYYVMNMRDVSERKIVEEALKESEKRYRALAENSIVGIWQVTPDGKTLYLNPAMRTLLEVDKDYNFSEASYHSFFTLDSRIKIRQEFEKRLKNIASTYDSEIIGNRGTISIVKISEAPLLTDDGEVHSLIGTFTDITSMKKAEEELRKAKELAEEATRLKDKYVSLVSHDLKGPLGTMLGYLEMIEDFDENGADSQRKNLINSARKSGQNMLLLINDVLNVSRLKAGQMIKDKSFIDAFSIANEVIENFFILAQQKGIILNNEVKKHSRIYADATMYFEVIQNLVSNAIKFCNRDDKVTLFTPEGKPATVGVSDTGVGIDPYYMDNLFSYEFKTSTTGTAGEIGTGFGLPLSKDIMEAHGGNLTVESTQGKGTTFLASLPDIKPKIMLVDDEKEQRYLFSLYLKDLDIELIEAENGAIALDILKVSPPHLMITDIMMPEVDGFDLLIQVKSVPSTKSIPVMMIASDSEIKTKEKALRLGAVSFNVKPISRDDFLAQVRKYIGY